MIGSLRLTLHANRSETDFIIAVSVGPNEEKKLPNYLGNFPRYGAGSAQHLDVGENVDDFK